MSQSIENNNVQNVVHFERQCKDLVQKIVQNRNNAGISQQLISDLLGVDRRKIIAIENLTKIDFELLLKYADKMDVEITLNYTFH